MVLLTLAWGTFAFGSVYPWAFTVLGGMATLVGIAGIVAGTRPVGEIRWLLVGLSAIGLLGLAQQIPLSPTVLQRVSPGTWEFLTRHDLRYAAPAAAIAEGAVATPPSHPLTLTPSATWVALGLLGAFSLFLAGMRRVLSRTSVSNLADGIVGLGVLLALVGIVQFLVLGDHAYGGMKIYGFWTPRSLLTTPFGPYVNKNHFAGWMVMALPLALALTIREYEEAGRSLDRRNLRSAIVWLSSPGGGRTVLLMLAVALMSLSLLMVRSRSGLGAAVAVIVLLIATVTRRFRSRRFGVSLAAILLVGGLLTAAWANQVGARAGNVGTSPLSMRLAIWHTALSIARDFPIFGAGLNTFGSATLIYQTTGDSHDREAHNDYLQIVAEGGLLLSVLAVALIGTIAVQIRRQFRANHDLRDIYWIRLGATLGLLAAALQASLEFSLQMPGNAALFVALLAIALYAPQRRARPLHS